MDVSPELLREVEFREQWRGYDKDAVDDFLERLAIALGQLQQQLADALGRAESAERRVNDGSADEEGVRRTLVLAQRTADAALDEARQEAAQLTADAEAQAAEALRAAEAAAAAVVAEAEQRVADELAPLLAQRDALEADVEALRSWAGEVRSRMVDELRQQLAWLEGSAAELPEPPDLLAIELPEAVGSPSDQAPDAEVAGGASPVDAAAGEQVPQVGGAGLPAPDDDGTGDRRVADPDATGAYDALVDAEPVPSGDYGQRGGALDTAAADDPFLAELRRAVTDDEPLGPRDDTVHDQGDDDDLSSSVFRRRKRR